MRKIWCRWFGHRWMRGIWLTNGNIKHRVDVCRCGARQRWHCLAH